MKLIINKNIIEINTSFNQKKDIINKALGATIYPICKVTVRCGCHWLNNITSCSPCYLPHYGDIKVYKFKICKGFRNDISL